MSRSNIVLKRRTFFFALVASALLTIFYILNTSTTSVHVHKVHKHDFNSDKLSGKVVEKSKFAVETSDDGKSIEIAKLDDERPQTIKERPSVQDSPAEKEMNDKKTTEEAVKSSLEKDSYHPGPIVEDGLDIDFQDDAQLFNGPEIMVSSEETDWKRLGEKLRVFKKLHELKYNNKSLSSEQSSLYEKAEKYLFSWIKPSFSSTIEMRNSFSGNGIVICMGNGQFKMALATLKMIRNVHFSNLPIEVFYMGDHDLSAENRKVLESLNDVTTRDIKTIFDDSQLKLGGWAIKTFAILASSFQNAMLIDADVVFLQSPDVLFASRIFGKYGSLFFHDRSLYSHGEPTKKWFKDLFPYQSGYSKTLRVFQDKTAHEQESGVVLINKKMNIPALLASCTLNVGDIRDRTYKFVFGDKETFWVGFETVKSTYRFNGYYPGTIGVSKKSEGGYEICARQLLHVDEHQVPTWINGGIQESKYDHSTPIVKMETYVVEPGTWTLKANNMACLVTENAFTLPDIYSDITAESGKILLETLAN